MKSHWNLFREFVAWLIGWCGDTVFYLNWNCAKGDGNVCISYTDLNERQLEILKDRMKSLKKVDGIEIWITDYSYIIYCKGV